MTQLHGLASDEVKKYLPFLRWVVKGFLEKLPLVGWAIRWAGLL